MTSGIQQAISPPFPHVGGVSISLPPVSVVICNFNQGRFIKEAILSVASQNYANFECVVVDDKSTDNSVELISAALDQIKDRRFRMILRDQNGGQMAAMYTGFDATTAPFIGFLDADDIWLPSFLETHISCHLNPEINAAVSSSNLALIDSSGAVVAGTRYSGVRCVAAMLGSAVEENEAGMIFSVQVPSLRQEVPSSKKSEAPENRLLEKRL